MDVTCPHLTLPSPPPRAEREYPATCYSTSCRPSHAKVVVQLVGVPRNSLVADHVDDAPVLDDVMAIGQGRGKMEILLDQEDREALLLQPADQSANLPDDDRGQTLGR